MRLEYIKIVDRLFQSTHAKNYEELYSRLYASELEEVKRLEPDFILYNLFDYMGYMYMPNDKEATQKAMKEIMKGYRNGNRYKIITCEEVAADNLKILRVGSFLKQSYIAKCGGVPVNVLEQYENGNRDISVHTHEFAQIVVNGYGIDPRLLFFQGFAFCYIAKNFIKVPDIQSLDIVCNPFLNEKQYYGKRIDWLRLDEMPDMARGKIKFPK